MDLININEFKKKAKIRYILHIVLVSLLLIGTLTGCLLSLFLSTLDYEINLAINLIVSIVVTLGAIFYFANVFPLISHYYRFYKNMSEVGLDHRRRRTFVQELEPKTMNYVKYRVLLFSYREGESEYKENLYVLDNDMKFIHQDDYKLTTYQNVIVKCEDLIDAIS